MADDIAAAYETARAETNGKLTSDGHPEKDRVRPWENAPLSVRLMAIRIYYAGKAAALQEESARTQKMRGGPHG